MYEFIICYRSIACDIIAVEDGFYGVMQKQRYQEALSHPLRSHNWEYGDLVPWNNSFWCSVKADNAMQALDIFMTKMKEKFHYDN